MNSISRLLRKTFTNLPKFFTFPFYFILSIPLHIFSTKNIVKMFPSSSPNISALFSKLCLQRVPSTIRATTFRIVSRRKDETTDREIYCRDCVSTRRVGCCDRLDAWKGIIKMRGNSIPVRKNFDANV